MLIITSHRLFSSSADFLAILCRACKGIANVSFALCACRFRANSPLLYVPMT